MEDRHEAQDAFIRAGGSPLGLLPRPFWDRPQISTPGVPLFTQDRFTRDRAQGCFPLGAAGTHGEAVAAAAPFDLHQTYA